MLNAVRAHVQAVRTVLWKNLLHLTRYKADLVFWAVLPILWIIPVILQGQAMAGGSKSSAFARFAGTDEYLTFVIIGSVLWGFVMSALWGAGNAIRWEQQSGTLQSLWSAPISRMDILIGTSLSESLTMTGQILFQLAMYSLILQIPWNLSNGILAFIAVCFMVAGLYGFGIFLAGLVLVYKEPEALTDFMSTGLLILCPVRYSLKSLPAAARFAALVIPFTLGIVIVRKALLEDFTFWLNFDILTLITALILLDAFLWFVGTTLFVRMENRCRRNGSLDAY